MEKSAINRGLKEGKENNLNSMSLKFSVVIPTYLRPNKLKNCLEALLQQSLQSKEYEIIVVDNDSNGSAEDVVRKANASRHEIIYERRTSNNVSEARNLGAQVAGGEWLAFLDDDCIAPPLWLERAAHMIRKNKGKEMVLGGDYLLPGEQLPPESTSVPGMMPAGSYLPEGNLFIPRRLYLNFGGMNPDLGPNEKRFGYHEGTDLQMRIEKGNPKTWPRIFVRELAVYHYQKPKIHLISAFLSGLDLGRLKGGRAQGDLFYAISRIGWLFARLLARGLMDRDIKAIRIELLRIGEICGSFLPDNVNPVRQDGPPPAAQMELKEVRVRISRILRLIGRRFGLWPYAPIRAVGCEEAGLFRGKKPALLEGPASHPVLPQSHPHLAEGTFRDGQSWCALLEGVAVYGPTIAVVDNQRRLLSDVSVEWGQPSELNWTMRSVWMPPARFLKGRTLILASTGGESYYHWMMDVLPRVGLAEKNGFELESFDHFVVNEIIKPFQRETLQALGIPLEKCRVFGKRKNAYLCEEAVLPSLPGPMGVPSAESVKFLRSSFPADPEKGVELLFVGRGNEGHRLLLEAKKIWTGLQRLGFTQIEPEKMSVAEQARAFRSARVVVGAHGAALANLAFCRPGTQVIELFSPLYVNPCYRSLCLAAGLLHGGVIGNGRDWNLVLSLEQASKPITASWELVKEALKVLE